MRRILLCGLLLVSCAAPRESLVVLPGDEGSLAVMTRDGMTVLTAPYATAQTLATGRVLVGTTTAEAVQARYGAVLAMTPQPGRLFTLYFTTGETALTPESQGEVPSMLAEVVRRGVAEVQITGHTDQTGTDLDNDALSQARADAVRAVLMQAGLQTTFVRTVGRGARAPLVDAPGQAEAKNRRVEVLVR